MFRINAHSSAALLVFWLCCVTSTQVQAQIRRVEEHSAVAEDQNIQTTPEHGIAKNFMLIVGNSFFTAPNVKVTYLAKNILNLNNDDDECNNVEVTATPTATPTAQPQSQPTTQPASQPPPPTTSGPTDRPRVFLSCPNQSGEGTIVPTDTLLSIAPAEKDTLCSLNFMMSTGAGEETTIPIGRSYNGNSWETVPGSIRLMFECEDSNDCSTEVPDKSSFLMDSEDELSDGYFQLSTLNVRDVASQDITARFLEQSTFGITKTDLEPWMDLDISNSLHELDDSFADWIENQINTVEATSHRKYYRERITARMVGGSRQEGKPLHPCEPGSRYRGYAFSWLESTTDRYKNQPLLTVEETADGSAYLLLFDGKPITETDSIEIEDKGSKPSFDLVVGESYELCTRTVKQEEFIGGKLCIEYGGDNRYFAEGNPQIKFDSVGGKRPEHVIQVDPSLYDELEQLLGTDKVGEELIFPNGITGHDDVCNNLSLENYPVYLDFQDGRWLAFDPMLKLIENDLEAPAANGGLDAFVHGSSCANVYRTFLNEDTCVFSGDSPACSNENDNEDFEIPLTSDDIIELFSLTGRYVYAVDDLRPEMSSSPCIEKQRSRWLNIGNSDSCAMTTFSDDTALTLSELIEDALENDEGTSDTLDILYRNTNDDCSIPITQNITANPVFIIAEGFCWELVHPDLHSVFDFTPWVSNHPGLAPAITQFAENEDAFLSFPGHHELYQWDFGENYREYVGRLDRTSSFRDIPASLQVESVLAKYGYDSFETDSKGVICGSPNEAATDFTKGEHRLSFNIGDFDLDSTGTTVKENQKYNLWTKLVTYSDDQLRQKMGWALSQIFPLTQDAVDLAERTEQFFYYYDIFVRHAFGNYFDILKEVSYSPMMADMLTYYESKSTAYTLDKKGVLSFADENFAREIMQLFTIGTIMLNMDGSPILDEYGNEILSYTNDHIMSYARAWTGFDRQETRGNIEVFNKNKLDPMRIIPEWRDVFPKINLMNGHVGDRYPLCADLPRHHFLRKGATYRLLGSKTRFELQENLRWGHLTLAHLNMTLDESSQLFAKLCNNPSNSGDCNFLSKVVLDENLNCFDRECNVDTLGIIQVTEGIWFEYLRQPCVELAYYNDAKVVNRLNRGSTGHPEMCANPKLEAAGEACCVAGDDVARGVNCEYTLEKMTFATSSSRCEDIGQTSCNYKKLDHTEDRPEYNPNPECFYYWYFPHWADTECLLKVKVDGSSGKAAVVHDTLNPYLSQGQTNIEDIVRESTPNFFSVYWQDEEFPSFDNNCGNNVCVSVYDGCVCDTNVIEEAVFNEAPASVQDVMESLFIGSVSPDTFDDSYYDDAVTLGEGTEVFFKSGTGQSYDMETIFKVEHLSKTFYLRNMRSTVVILDGSGSETQFTFRNPPHFLDLQSGDARDAHYETQAVLESYFFHPNVPPFLAIHFINRFGISNPSPRYIKAVATAFKTGVYEYEKNSDSSMMTFGSFKYGDLEATIAAVLLDREARSIVLDSDSTYGGMREPLAKIISVFRAMEYAPDLKQGSQRYNMVLRDMRDRIGQMTHDYESIFSFFRREFAPIGPVQQGDLVAPEGQRYNSPSAISLMNGLYALVKFGLTECREGFGYSYESCGGKDEGEYGASYGQLTFSPEAPDDMESVVDELALLLTAGRLSSERRSIITRVASEAEDSDAGLRLAQQLVLSSPEFHTTNLMDFSGTARDIPDPPIPSNRPYKAVVVLLLKGGLDSYNLIIPHSGCDTDMYGHYVDVRGSVNIPYSQLSDSIIPAKTNQVCDNFAIHPSLPLLKTLYDDDELTFFANTGVLQEYVTKDDWKYKTNTQLFAHNIQQRDAQQVNLVGLQSTGVGGRMVDVLTDKGFQTGSFSIDAENYILSGQPSKSPLPIVLNRKGQPEFNEKESVEDMTFLLYELNNITDAFSGKFGKTWSDLFDKMQSGRIPFCLQFLRMSL